MSLEEDTELRDIVLETLDQRGVVGKAKAMLRANIFTALEETVAPQDKMYLLNKKLKESLATDEGQLMAGLIVDYLTCLELEFSKTVFEPETGFDCQSISRPSLCKSLGISLPSDKQLPLLAQVIKNSHAGTGDQSLSPRRPQNIECLIPKDLTSKQIADAKTKFSKYDQDGNGTIEKDELRQLFVDMFPNFNRNMLDRYVTDEFRAADTDFSAGIDFDEFLDLYRRLFITCRSVVSHDLSDIIGPISTPRSPSPRSSKIPVKSDSQSSSSSRKDNSPSPRKPVGTNSNADVETDKNSGSFLSGLPDLDAKISPSNSPPNSYNVTGNNSESRRKGIDKRSVTELGFEVPDDDESLKTKSDYDDDFERSSFDKSSKKSYDESITTADSVSTEDLTDKINDDDDIDELSKHDNETEDKSITDDNSMKDVDYWEIVPKK